MPRVWIPSVGQAGNAPYCQALRSMGLGTQSYRAGHKVQPRQPQVPRRRPAYLSTHTLPFFPSKSIVWLLSSEAVWRFSLLRLCGDPFSLARFLNGTFCTNRKSLCGHHPSVQVLIEDVKVWRRMTTADTQPPALPHTGAGDW